MCEVLTIRSHRQTQTKGWTPTGYAQAFARVACRGCSQPLQRAVVDFGANHAFGQVPDKLKEHYGITLPASTIRHITERHGQRIPMAYVATNDHPDKAGCDCVIAERDGSMIPIVEVDEVAPNKRKGKVES